MGFAPGLKLPPGGQLNVSSSASARIPGRQNHNVTRSQTSFVSTHALRKNERSSSALFASTATISPSVSGTRNRQSVDVEVPSTPFGLISSSLTSEFAPSNVPHFLNSISQPKASSPGLPDFLSRLLDPNCPVQLPPAESVPTSRLDNRALDKLVASLGRNRATWRRALLLHEWLKDSGHAVDDRLCTTLIRVCSDHGAGAGALGVYDWMKAPLEAGGASLRPTMFTFTAAMRAALAANMLLRATQIWADVQASGLTPDCRLCTTYMEVCARLHNTDEALALYAAMTSAPSDSPMTPTVHAFTAAMRAATEGGRWGSALEIWQDMESAGVAPSGHAYAAVISACAAGADWVRAVQLFERMAREGITPDVVSCTALVSALAAGGEAERAASVLRWMLAQDLAPNVRTYTALLSAMCRARQWGRAVEILRLMRLPEWGAVEPNAFTYSALLKSLAENGQWQLAEAVFREIEEQVLGVSEGGGSSNGAGIGTAPGPSKRHTSTAALSSQSAAVSGKEAPQMGESLGQSEGGKGDDVDPPQWISPAQLNGLQIDILDHGNRDPGYDPTLLPASRSQSIQQHRDGNSAVAYAAVSAEAEAVRRDGSSVAVGALINHGKQTGAPMTSKSRANNRHMSTIPASEVVNEVVCGALMLAYERSGMWQEAINVLERARALGVTPNIVMFNTAISAAGKAGQIQLAEQLFSASPGPDAVTYETLTTAYGIAGLPEKAEAAVRRMMTAGHRPRDTSYVGVIAAYSLSGDWRGALRVPQRLMRHDNVAPSVHVYNALIAACARAGQYDAALDTYHTMTREGIEPDALTRSLLGAVGRKGAEAVEQQQVKAAALSAVFVAAGSLLIQTGIL